MHRLLGTCRDRVPVYFSSAHHDTAQAYADEALLLAGAGLDGLQAPPAARAVAAAGPPPPVGFDIEACAAVREAVGPGMTLMLDSSWSYSYTEALGSGGRSRSSATTGTRTRSRPTTCTATCGSSRHLRIPMLATEITPGGLEALPPWITSGATDFLRGDVVIKGGITGLMKIAHLAEAFGMNCEIHDAYNALNNVADLHVMMAIDNCDWFEVLAFNRAGEHSLEHLSYGLTEPLAMDARRATCTRRPARGSASGSTGS